MVSLLRNGTRMFFAAATDHQQALDYLAREFQAEAMDIDMVFDKADEFHSIVYLVPELADHILKKSVTGAVLIRREAPSLLCQLYTTAKHSPITAIRAAPHTIIMRSIGNMEKMLQLVKEDHGGVLETFDESIEHSTEHSTIIGLTDKPINRSTSLADMHKLFLRLDGDYTSIQRELKMHAFSYVNSSMPSNDWNELEIRIFDSYSAFKVHYDRLLTVLDSLELGIVLGEAWSTDYPRVLLAVEVYSLRFFTFKEPKHIKRILFGLEHLADGTRIVDYDLYHKHKKIYWKETVKGKVKLERAEEASLARQEVYDQLDIHTKAELELLETEILKTRK